MLEVEPAGQRCDAIYGAVRYHMVLTGTTIQRDASGVKKTLRLLFY